MNGSNDTIKQRRSSGVLMHVSSLPGPYGIGDMGSSAMQWIESLARAKQTWWQILPLSPPVSGGSPYQCSSAFAGNPSLISPDSLIDDGLLRRTDIDKPSFSEDHVDFAGIIPFKIALLALAWERFRDGAAPQLRAGFDTFCKAEALWLNDFALFMAIKEARPGESWADWPPTLARRTSAALREARREFADAIDRHCFIQFIFYRQWSAVRAHAVQHGIKLIGDVPIFIAGNSADVWVNHRQFLLDRQYRPKVVAGVPPDYFSATGQRWGNPLYNWDAMRRDGYSWWVARARAALSQTDRVRIDHFRGFAAAWHVPASAPTAQHGKWVKGPGADLFNVLKKQLAGLPFIAEDLGVITPDVEQLRDDFGLPGMRVLQFAFGGGPANPFLPHNFSKNSVVYTGTHDNDTTAGWYAALSRAGRVAVKRYVPQVNLDPAAALLRLAWSSVADCAIAPLQDLLSLPSSARLNTPGTITGNWTWRVTAKQLRTGWINRLGEITETFGRSSKNNPSE